MPSFPAYCNNGALKLRCENHPSVDSIAECASCTAPLCGICANYTSTAVLCERCLQDSANSDFVASQVGQSNSLGEMVSEPEVVRHEPNKQRLEESIEKREKLHMAIVIFGCIFIGIRLFTTLGSPIILNQAEVAAEELAIAQRTLCMQKFWEIANLLQNDELPDESLNCFESGLPHIVTRVGDDVIVTHPRPDLLGFSELYVSKNNPVPTVAVL